MLSQWLNVYLWWCVDESNLSLPVISALVSGSLFCFHSEAEEAGVHPPLHPPFVLRSPRDSLMDLLLSGCESSR